MKTNIKWIFFFLIIVTSASAQVSEKEKLAYKQFLSDNKKRIEEFQKKRKSYREEYQQALAEQRKILDEYRKKMESEKKVVNVKQAELRSRLSKERSAFQKAKNEAYAGKKDALSYQKEYEKINADYQKQQLLYQQQQNELNESLKKQIEEYNGLWKKYSNAISAAYLSYQDKLGKVQNEQNAHQESYREKLNQFRPVIEALERERMPNRQQKETKKSYVASGKTLTIQNSFGEVKVIVWDKNEINVRVNMVTSSGEPDLAEYNLKNLEVKETISGNHIRLETVSNKANNENKPKCNNCSSSMSIDYTIYTPANIPLTINNSFGDVIIPDYTGSVQAEISNGDIIAGRLSKHAKIKTLFGSAKIKAIKDADLQFSNAQVQINELVGNVTINMQFCTNSKFGLSDKLESFNLTDSHCQIKLIPDNDLNGNYNFNIEQGRLVNNTKINIQRTNEFGNDNNNFKVNYKGKSGAGNTNINVTSVFGQIQLGDSKMN